MSPLDARAALAGSPELPLSLEGAPVFAEPWHAEAFAIAVHLNERGLFTWSEWAETLSAKLHQPGRSPDGSDYFDCWVEALSALLESKGVADAATILSLQHSWQRAAEATPHGKPIELANDPAR
ncbi:nitrile hydratase accessory protein [Rhizobium sp. LjRoot254]|uniref:nitrile hydratase accessory protein n=1 Tax=Rhizobium sp. LjRoot254 TaxID=3342297 RepID=UPI003ECC2546